MSEPAGSGAAELAEHLFTAAIGALELANLYLGHTLGLYRELADHAPLTSEGLAARSGCDERYVREWLQAQAASGLVTAAGADLAAATFALAAGAREVLVDELSPYYSVSRGLQLAGIGAAFPELVAAFRSGAGVPLSAYGPASVAALSVSSRAAFHQDLVARWLPAAPDLTARLADAGAPAQVADLGCGAGWAAITLAEAYPHLHIVGYDVDPEQVALARRHAAEAGVAGQVSFQVRDLAQPPASHERYDLVLLLRCFHDLGFPDVVLGHVRRVLRPGGTVLILDTAAEAEPTWPSTNPVQRYYANTSPVLCLPQSRVAPGSRPIGTLLRPATLHALAQAAGFADVVVLPVDHPRYRLYRLLR